MKKTTGSPLKSATCLPARATDKQAVNSSCLIANSSDPCEKESKWPLKKLSQRECEVLRLIGEGYSIRKTAVVMGLSPKTIETYRDRIKRKLAIRSGAELRHLAILARMMDQTVLSQQLAQHAAQVPPTFQAFAVIAPIAPPTFVQSTTK